MRYSRFTIKNYKGIKDLTIDLNKEPKSKVFTLVGLNESGKTSILEAINLLSTNVSQNKRHELIPKSEKINFNSLITVEGILEISDTDFKLIEGFLNNLGYKEVEQINELKVSVSYFFQDSIPQTYGGLRKYTLQIDAKTKGSKKKASIDSSSENYKKVVQFIDTSLVPRILYYPNFLFDFPNKIIIGNEEGEVIDSAYTKVIQDILNSIQPDLTIEKHLLQRLIKNSESDREALESTLNKMSSKVSQTVFNAWSKLFNVGSKEIVISSGNEKTAEGVINYFLEFKLKEGSDKYHISERSLGFKWFFTFLLFTEFRKNRITDSGELLFLLDEPASNLHSTAQKNLLKTFKDLISKSTLIFTTHSHHLINPEWLNGAYIVRNKALNYEDELNYDSNKTDIEAILYKQFVSKYPDQKDYYQPILDCLDYQPGLLEKVPSIIITEGKNDYYTFRYINKLYFNNKYSNLNFFPGGGANANSPTIRLYLAWNRKFYIILDGDKAGESARKEYLEIFGKEIEGLIFSFSEISTELKGLSTEGLFTREEQLAITQYFDPKLSKYEKGKFNSAIQNMLFENHKANLCNQTLEKFKNILDFFDTKILIAK